LPLVELYFFLVPRILWRDAQVPTQVSFHYPAQISELVPAGYPSVRPPAQNPGAVWLYLKWLAGVLLGLLLLLRISIRGFLLLLDVLRHGVISLSPPGKCNALHPGFFGPLVRRAVVLI